MVDGASRLIGVSVFAIGADGAATSSWASAAGLAAIAEAARLDVLEVLDALELALSDDFRNFDILNRQFKQALGKNLTNKTRI